MQSRTRTFLTFSLFCLLPLLIIAAASLFAHRTSSYLLIQSNLQQKHQSIKNEFESTLRQRSMELETVAANADVRQFVSRQIETTPNETQLREALKPLRRFAIVSALSSDNRVQFTGEFPDSTRSELRLRTQDLSTERIETSEGWTSSTNRTMCDVADRPMLGTVVRCTSPVPGADGSSIQGALVGYLKIESLCSSFAPITTSTSSSEQVIVIDRAKRIVYHTNNALNQQPVDSAAPYLSVAAEQMSAGRSNTDASYKTSDGENWLMTFGPLMPKLSLGVATDYSHTAGFFSGWPVIAVAVVLGLLATWLLSNYYLKKTRSIDRVAAGVGAIAHGDLNHQFDLRSRDDLRPMADNLALLTAQMREQIARETESRQLQAFVRLSAMLTHDLKNSIEALSLMVSNMERHFDNPEFRTDAMRTLTKATENLKSLVSRLSNPVVTLSGEHQRPRPTDLVPMLRRVVAMTAEQAPEQHAIYINLPDSLPALVDGERVEKVFENLIINAIEAMAGSKGVLRVEGSTTKDGQVSLTVSDTGTGMSQRFIEERLFHAFATTKKTGVGLGLYTCREVVRANGGSIEVESAQGAGTTFRVMLPSAVITSDDSKSSPTSS